MRNPLRKRLPRELRKEKGKYIALFLFQVILIGFVSGYLVANGSMIKAYRDSFETYRIEDGHFTLLQEPDKELIERIEETQDIQIASLWYKNKNYQEHDTVRVYPMRTEVNLACLMEGTMPEKDNDIVIDRLYAENNSIVLGDSIELEGTDYTICGFVALSDYSALFKNNTDMMFDANHFTISLVTQEAFDAMSNTGLKYCYAWTNNEGDLDDQNAYDKARDVMEFIAHHAILTDFVVQSENQAIQFTGSDIGGDKAMVTVILYVVILLLAFSYAVTTRSTMEQEASSIGTLLASGYTRRELLQHYLTLPVLVTVLAALLGNILGYTAMKKFVVDMYYSSYSLPTYITVWSAEAFWKTTLVPALIILIVNTVVLSHALSLPPIQFLRHELRRKKKQRVMRLPPLGFLTRYRIRIILQNASAYVTLMVGIMMTSFLLMFGLGFGPLIDHFKVDVLDSKFADYQYILKGTTQEVDTDEYSAGEWLAPYLSVFRRDADVLEIEDVGYLLGFDTETAYPDAEKYCVESLQLPNDGEDIMIYGIQPDSQYLDALSTVTGERDVVVSDSYLKKYDLKIGDTIVLKRKYEDDVYEFMVADCYPYAASLAVFLPIDTFRSTFGLTKDSFSGYLSDQKLVDIDEEGIATLITTDDLTVLADQLKDSMGGLMPLVDAISLLIYVIVLYLLSKMIVDRNAQSISMIKILGYSDSEISGLYNVATAMVVGISLVISIPICYKLFDLIMKYYVMAMLNGYINFYLPPMLFFEMVAFGAICFFAVSRLQLRTIRRIPLSQALKHVE